MRAKLSTATNQYHLLRHYNDVSPKYANSLLGNLFSYYDYKDDDFKDSMISKEDIVNARNTIGTKFLPNIQNLETPKQLLEIIELQFELHQKSNNLKWKLENDCKSTSFIIDYQYPVGQKNCLPLYSLTQAQKQLVKQVIRSKCKGESNIMINTISGLPLNTTNQIYVEITSTPKLPFLFVSAYPFCNLSGNLSLSELVFVI